MRILGIRSYVVGFVITLSCLILIAIGIVQAAAGYDLTSPGSKITINGAIFEAFNPDDPTGSGLFQSFVRISGGNIVQGYNTNFRPIQFNENDSPTFTLSRLLSEVPQFYVEGTLYREFQLDINQNKIRVDYLITLDTVELYQSPFADLCGYPFDGSGGGHSGCTTNNTATIIYDMDAGLDNYIVMDYRNNEGSGKRDLRMLVPDSLFNQDPNCNYSGTGCTVYITIYSRFGGDVSDYCDPGLSCPNNDGPEEWGVRIPTIFPLYLPIILR